MKKRQVYEVWQNYDNFIRSLHLKSIEEQRKDSKKRFIHYLIKLLIMIFASFLTTLTFQFLINPNGLFNSGINGVIQVLTSYSFSKYNFNMAYYSNIYYAIVLLVNIMIVSVVHLFYPDNLEMNSTALFYVLFQFCWNNIFKYLQLQKYIFSKLSPEAWTNISSREQTGLSLAFYIVIAIASSMIHTYGYKQIYLSKSTPGGFEIITSTLSQGEGKKKSRISVGKLSKGFSIFVIFFITVFRFIVFENDPDVRRNRLVSDLNKNLEESQQIKSWEQAEPLIEKWIETEKAILTSENTVIDSTERKMHLQFSKVFRTKTGVESLADPAEIRYYLRSNKELLVYLRKKYANSENRQEIAKLRELENSTYEMNLFGYLKYVTNDERLWATLVYIFLSSYLINWLFPKNTVVVVTARITSESDLEKMLEILKNYDPVYSKAILWNKKVSSEIYVLNCSMTKWNYHLLSIEIRKLGEISISTTDESN